MAAVGNDTEKSPLLPIVAGLVIPLMVTETDSPAGGKNATPPVTPLIVPPSVTVLVPTGIDGDGVIPLNTAGTAWTVMLSTDRICWLDATTFALLVTGPTDEDGLRMWTLKE